MSGILAQSLDIAVVVHRQRLVPVSLSRWD